MLAWLSHDPILSASGASGKFGAVSFASTGGRIDNRAGRVDGITFVSFKGRSADFPIAKLTFRAAVALVGPLDLRMTESSLNPFASEGQRISVAFGAAE